MIYLLTNLGNPASYVNNDLTADEQNRTCYHLMSYRGNYDCIQNMLNYDRVCIKKCYQDQLILIKQNCQLKSLDIKHG